MLTIGAGYFGLHCRSVNRIDTLTSKQTNSASGQSDTLSPFHSTLSCWHSVSPHQIFTALHCCSSENKTQIHVGITKETAHQAGRGLLIRKNRIKKKEAIECCLTVITSVKCVAPERPPAFVLFCLIPMNLLNEKLNIFTFYMANIWCSGVCGCDVLFAE